MREQECGPTDLADGVEQLARLAGKVLLRAQRHRLCIAVAESCTGGLLASLLTDIEGLSGCFERGFIAYSNEAKAEMLGVDRMEIERHGAVSPEVAAQMAQGALLNSRADLAVAITGFAGPGAKGDEAGLVHLAASRRDSREIHRECHFGDCGRDRTRQLAVEAALEMLDSLLRALEDEAR